MNKYENVMRHMCELLDTEGIPYEVSEFQGGYQWKNIGDFDGGDIIIHRGSYNNDAGYVESYGMPWDDGDVTSCSVKEMVDLIAGRRTRPENPYEYSIFDMFDSLKTFMF